MMLPPFPTYRYNFSPNFICMLKEFSSKHTSDDLKTYRNEWARWCEENSIAIDNEIRILIENGFKGNIQDKMFKSGRFYFRNNNKNKEQEEEEEEEEEENNIDNNIIKRDETKNKSTHLPKTFIKTIDNHIERTSLKPKMCFSEYCRLYKEELKTAIEFLCEMGYDENTISNKIKKTFNNRFYLFRCKNTTIK